jgi:pyruvate,orthophosphate dikinase
MIKSRALEVNIADYHVDVAVDEKYAPIQEVMSTYYGLTEGLNTFLKELSHPYKNWQFIVQEARGYSLNYFHLLKNHPSGPDAATLFVEIFAGAVDAGVSIEVRTDAVDNLLLFLQKIIKESGSDIAKFKPVLDNSFDKISSYQGEDFFLFIKSFYQIKKLAEAFFNCSSEVVTDYKSLNVLLIKYFKQAFAYWLNEEDPKDWFVKKAGEIDKTEIFNNFFDDISHRQTQDCQARLKDIVQSENKASADALKKLLKLPGYNHFLETYREIPQRLLDKGAGNVRGHRWKLIFLFHIMNISGLSMIHEEALRDINRTMSWVIGNEEYQNVQQLIQKTFSILKICTEEFPATDLICFFNMVMAV